MYQPQFFLIKSNCTLVLADKKLSDKIFGVCIISNLVISSKCGTKSIVVITDAKFFGTFECIFHDTLVRLLQKPHANILSR